jgi:cytochrome c oxidase subunit 3
MGTLSTTISIKEPELHQGGEGTPPRPGGRDGDGGRASPNYGDRLRRARLGLAIGLTPVFMLFVSFTSAYIVRQGMGSWDPKANAYARDWLQINLPTQLLLINTIVLLLSTITVELARRQAPRRGALVAAATIAGVSPGKEQRFPWLGVTILLGAGFLAGQWMAWKELGARGFYLATGPSSSFVYLLTGAHAVHLAGGLLALLYAASTSLLKRPLEVRRSAVDITAWYWHFMGLLWIYIFALLEFAR